MNSQLTTSELKTEGDIRFLTFNVNGIRTFFHYAPFSEMRQSLKQVFDWFGADIITFQELKTETLSLTKWGKVGGFYSFISIPQHKKGYSGVGCWVRIPDEDDPMFPMLRVVKAEEGITGLLTIKTGKTVTRYRDDPSLGIGGYCPIDSFPDNIDEATALRIDSEGRCVLVELGCGIVVISLYCPANSSCTEEGELFRMRFLRLLFLRVKNLQQMGKHVVLMGDLNICRDLIDHAVTLDENNISINADTTGKLVDEKYYELCSNFIINPDFPHRKLLNEQITDSLVPELRNPNGLIDSTRKIQGRDRLKMYTVWNTLKNMRPNNYGSRIDFILINEAIGSTITKANILPEINGSDHCPVYCDIDMKAYNHLNPCSLDDSDYKLPRFEARYKYNLQNRNIFDMFSKSGSTAKSVKVTKKVPSRHSKQEESMKGILLKKASSMRASPFFNDTFGKPPMCKHGEVAILKTSKTSNNPGKKFWTCARPRGDSNDKEASCGFFQWV